MKSILMLMLGIFSLLTIVNAQVLISPSSINIAGYPGETIQQNITITTDGNYAVNISLDTDKILIAPSDIIVDGSQFLTFNFTIKSDADALNYSLVLTASIQAPDIPQNSPSYSGNTVYLSGGTKTIYQNNTIIQYRNNTIFTNQSSAPIIVNPKSNLWLIIAVIILSIITIILIVWILNSGVIDYF